MTPEQLELFREAILQVLDEQDSKFGLSARAIGFATVPLGFRPTPDETAREVTYLKDKGLVGEVGKIVSPENTCYRLTAAGRDYLAGA